MKIQFFIYIPTFLLLFLLGLLVYLKNHKTRSNKLFILLDASILFWLIPSFVADIATDSMISLRALQIGYLISLLIPYFFILFSLTFLSNKKLNKLTVGLLTPTPIVLSLFSFSVLNINEVTIRNWGAEVTKSGIIYSISAAYFFGYALLALLVLIRKQRKSKGSEKDQLRLIIYGTAFAAIANVATSYVFVLFGNSQYAVLFGIPSFVIFVGCITYAIVRHKLFDIRAVIARSVTFVLLITTMAGVYGVVAFQVINVILKGSSNTARQLADVLLAVVLAFTFGPLRRFFEKLTDRVFYRDRYDPQVLVNKIGRILASEIDLEKLCRKVISELTVSMRLSFTDIVVFGEKEVHFQTRVFSPDQHHILIADLKKLGRLAVVRDELATGERKEVMDKYGVSASLALRTSEEFIGYLLLGEKKSGDIYNDQDIQILKIIANELSVAIQNAKAFTEIQLFNATLQEKVQRATKNLRHANEQLKELDQAKDEFISMASHQLRTPLTTVKGYASMLAEGDFGKLNSQQKEPVQEALDGASRMARLIDDLLNVSRMEAGRFFIDAVSTDVVKMTQQEVDQLQSLAQAKKVELVYEPPKTPLKPILLDENKTRQVIMNLVDNAIHYSQPPAGGGHVHVKLTAEGSNLVFTVQDDGIGVPKEQQGRLFHKMFRAGNAKNVRPDGTGLGLYLVKRVVEDQGGQIIFQSEEGKGSLFGFRLPLSGVPQELLGKAKEIAKTAHLTA
ncbi:hypothetical protein HYX70_04775 [Candidatus Saccharibacteria bacterium]|nr:hypothetical protein [Candidatus Saccharibacteria bacterium]